MVEWLERLLPKLDDLGSIPILSKCFFPTWISGGRENFKLDSIADAQFFVHSSISTSYLASGLDILSQEFKEVI